LDVVVVMKRYGFQSALFCAEYCGAYGEVRPIPARECPSMIRLPKLLTLDNGETTRTAGLRLNRVRKAERAAVRQRLCGSHRGARGTFSHRITMCFRARRRTLRSFLRVSKAEIDLDPAIDPYNGAVYAKAAENLLRMIAAEVLAHDDKPCYYAYRLIWRNRVETGLAAVASIAAYAANRIRNARR